MRASLGNEIPDTAPYTEWLAIVGSIVVAVLVFAVLFSNGILTLEFSAFAGRGTTAFWLFLHCMPAKAEVDMLFKSKAPEPEKPKNAAANAAEVTESMGQQQHSVVEQVAASPPVGAGDIKEVEMLNSMKSSASEKDKNAAANAAEVVGRTVQPHDQSWARSEPTTKA